MRFSVVALAGISIFFSTVGAQALYVGPPPPPPPSNVVSQDGPSCSGDPVYAGMRANGSAISGAFSAKIHRVSECYSGVVDRHYHDQNLKRNISNNPTLQRYLADNGISLNEVVGAQYRLGKLIVFVSSD